jgi:hypothetical protein
VEENQGDLFDRLGAVPARDPVPDESTRFFGRYHRNPVLPLLALLVTTSAWSWFVNVSSLYSEYEEERRRLDPWAPGAEPSDLTRAASDVAVSAGVATSVMWWVGAGLVIAASVVVGLFASYAHSAVAPKVTAVFGLGLVLVWVVAAVLLRSAVVSNIAALRGLAVT